MPIQSAFSLGCAAAFAWSVLAAGNPDAAKPRELRHANAHVQEPLWVPESLALTAEKRLDPAKFHPRVLQIHERRQQRNTRNVTSNATGGPHQDPCVVEPVVEHHKPNTTLPDLVQSALDIVAGNVVQTETGLWKGLPATLLTVRITDRMKWSGNFQSAEVIRVVYPSGRITTRDGVLCGVPALTTLVPAAGDQALIFVLMPPVDGERTVAEPQANREFFFQRGSTTVGAPAVVNGRQLPALAETTGRLIRLQDDTSAEVGERP